MTEFSSYLYTEENLNALEFALGSERLRVYVLMAKGDRSKAFDLYLWNIAISTALYENLHILEIAMRTSMNRELCSTFGLSWFDEPSLFLGDQLDRLTQAKRHFESKADLYATDFVSEVSFGFWTDILHYRMYDSLWNRCLHKAFPQRPKGTTRSSIAPIARELKELTMRLF